MHFQPFRTTFLDSAFIKWCSWFSTHKNVKRILYTILASIIIFWISLFCFFTFYVYPNLNQYKNDVQIEISKALGFQVSLGKIEGGWNKLRPEIIAKQVDITDGEHHLQLDEVKTILSIRSIFQRNIQLSLLDVQSLPIQIIRTKENHILINNIDIDPLINKPNDNSTILDYTLIRINTDLITFEDQFQKLPAIEFSNVQGSLKNKGNNHRAKLSITLPKKIGGETQLNFNWKEGVESGFNFWEISGGLKTAQLNLSQLSRWINLPYDIQSAYLNTDVNFSAQGSQLTSLEGQIQLSKVNAVLAEKYTPLVLNEIKGHVNYTNSLDNYKQTLKLTQFQYKKNKNESSSPIDLDISQVKSADGTDITLNTNKINLTELAEISKHIPLPNQLNEQINTSKINGTVNKINLKISTQEDKILNYNGFINFEHLGFQYKDDNHAVKNISGQLSFNEKGGQVQIDSEDGTLSFPGLVQSPAIFFQNLQVVGKWSIDDERLTLTFEPSVVSNTHTEVSWHGQWEGNLSPQASDVEKYGHINMEMTIPRAKAEFVANYLPTTTSKTLLNWLNTSIKKGDLSNGKVIMKGDLWDMPFDKAHQNTVNQYSLSFDVHNGQLNYLKGYPELNQIQGHYQQTNDHITFQSQKSTFNNFNLSQTIVVMPEILADTNRIEIHLVGTGETDGILKLLKTAPLPDNINEITKEATAKGNGALTLDIKSNVQEPNTTTYHGQYLVVNNDVNWKNSLPKFTGVGGQIQFSNDGLSSKDGIKGKWMGEPFSIKIKQTDRTTEYQAEAFFVASEMRKISALNLWNQFSGKTPFNLKMVENDNQKIISGTSDLTGLSSILPGPLSKNANGINKLSYTHTINYQNNQNQDIAFSIDGMTNGRVLLNKNNTITGGQINIGNTNPIRLQKNQVNILVNDQLNFDYWATQFKGQNTPNSTLFQKSGLTYNIKASSVLFSNFLFNDVTAAIQAKEKSYSAEIVSKELQGDIDWYNSGTSAGGENGLLKANLVGFNLSTELEEKISKTTERNTTETLPNLEIQAKEFQIEGKHWGKLSVKATNQKTINGNLWSVDPVVVDGENTTFRGRLTWLMKQEQNGQTRNATTLDFKLNTDNVDEMLTKLGYPDTVKRGVAKAEGTLTWNETPLNFSPSTLSGNFKMNSQNGQFYKMDPGVGRLLGLLSLQSLPQRFLLDFRDVFTGGLAYESLEGSFRINQGIMKTDNVEIDTPAARILMAGTVDLSKQTQDIVVKVRPSLTNGVAIGVAVINPIAGAVTWVADKVLGSPISKLFSSTYYITGTWSNPEVDKTVNKEENTSLTQPSLDKKSNMATN